MAATYSGPRRLIFEDHIVNSCTEIYYVRQRKKQRFIASIIKTTCRRAPREPLRDGTHIKITRLDP